MEEPHMNKPGGDILMTEAEETGSLKKFTPDDNQEQKANIPSLILASNTSGIKLKPALTKFQMYRSLVGCFLIHIVIGTIYIWGGVSPYVSSYLKSKNKDVMRQQISLIFPFMSLICNTSTTVGVKLCDKIPPQYVVGFSAIMICICVLIVSFMETLAGYLVFYMILFGFFSGVIYLIPIKIAWGYFPNNKGTVSGLILFGYGLGGFIFNFICKAIVNPNDSKPTLVYEEGSEKIKYFDSGVYDNIPNMFKILFGCYTVLFLIGFFLVKFPHFEKPVDHPIHHHLDQNHPHRHHNSWSWHVLKLEHEHNQHRFLPECQSLKEGMLSYAFISMFLLAVTMIYFGQFMINQYKNFGTLYNELNNDAFLTTIGSLASICNGSSRLFWAFLYDKFGFRTVFYTAATIQSVLSGTMQKTTESQAFYGVWVCLSLWCMGAYLGTFPAHTSKIFGPKLGTQFYSFILIGIGGANMVAFLTRQFQLQFENCFWIGLAFSLFGMVLVFFQKKTYLWEVDDDGISLEGAEGPMRRVSVMSLSKPSFYNVSVYMKSKREMSYKKPQSKNEVYSKKELDAL